MYHPVQLLSALRQGKTVVISFGRNNSSLDYALLSNILARTISEVWQAEAERYRTTNKGEPRPLVIVVEEAHRFLGDTAQVSAFSILAREMRKSAVTLLIVDQRPSQISAEVMSQVGTRFSYWMGDADDIDAAVSGLPAKDVLRRMIANLKPTGQMLVAGYGVPTPIALNTRWVDQRFIHVMPANKRR